jgi:hypothetical protein
MGVVHHAAITAAGWWAVIAAACTLATVASIGERLVVPARARHLPAPALISAVTISAALIWLALQHLFPDDPGTADTALYIATFIAASAATIILAITTESGFPPRGPRHSVGHVLLGLATVGLLLALADAFHI